MFQNLASRFSRQCCCHRSRRWASPSRRWRQCRLAREIGGYRNGLRPQLSRKPCLPPQDQRTRLNESIRDGRNGKYGARGQPDGSRRLLSSKTEPRQASSAAPTKSFRSPGECRLLRRKSTSTDFRSPLRLTTAITAVASARGSVGGSG